MSICENCIGFSSVWINSISFLCIECSHNSENIYEITFSILPSITQEIISSLPLTLTCFKLEIDGNLMDEFILEVGPKTFRISNDKECYVVINTSAFPSSFLAINQVDFCCYSA